MSDDFTEKLTRAVAEMAKALARELDLYAFEIKCDTESEQRGFKNQVTDEELEKENLVVTLEMTCAHNKEDAAFQAEVCSHEMSEAIRVEVDDRIDDVDSFLEQVLGRHDGGLDD